MATTGQIKCLPHPTCNTASCSTYQSSGSNCIPSDSGPMIRSRDAFLKAPSDIVDEWETHSQYSEPCEGGCSCCSRDDGCIPLGEMSFVRHLVNRTQKQDRFGRLNRNMNSPTLSVVSRQSMVTVVFSRSGPL